MASLKIQVLTLFNELHPVDKQNVLDYLYLDKESDLSEELDDQLLDGSIKETLAQIKALTPVPA